MLMNNTDTVFPRIIAGGDYFFFSHQKGAIIRGRRLSKVPVTVQAQNAGPTKQTSPFSFGNWWLYHVVCKTVETTLLNVK